MLALPGDRKLGRRARSHRAGYAHFARTGTDHVTCLHPVCEDAGVEPSSNRAAGEPDTARVQIIGRPGCHLCEEAERVVEQVCGRRGIGYRVVSIEDDPVLADRYAEYIPVTMVDGQQHDFYRVDPERLAAALDR